MVLFYVSQIAALHSSSLGLSFVLLERLALLFTRGKIGTFISRYLFATSIFTMITFTSIFFVNGLLLADGGGSLESQTGKFELKFACLTCKLSVF